MQTPIKVTWKAPKTEGPVDFIARLEELKKKRLQATLLPATQLASQKLFGDVKKDYVPTPENLEIEVARERLEKLPDFKLPPPEVKSVKLSVEDYKILQDFEADNSVHAKIQPIEEKKQVQFGGDITLNEEQQNAVRLACDFSVPEFPIFGSAGTGKTTLLSAAFKSLAELVPAYGGVHNYLAPNLPAIAVVSYTRRAVRNLKRSLAKVGASESCITIHKLLEYQPDYYDEVNADGTVSSKMRFIPKRNESNKLDGLKIIFIDEAGMCSVPLYQELKNAAPYDCRFIFLGDIYQLPPVYGSSILGYKLADAAAGTIPSVELRHVYRQALDSPILAKALQVKDGKCFDFSEKLCQKARVWESPKGASSKSVLHVMPIKETSDDKELLSHKFGTMFAESYKAGRFNPDEDVVLIPHGKPHTFGSWQINLHIAQGIADKGNLDIHEIYSGFNKLYLCVGDKIACGSLEGRIKAITPNAKYLGKYPRPASKLIDRWGKAKMLNTLDPDHVQDLDNQPPSQLTTLDQIDAFLDQSRVEERKAQASHIVDLQLEDSSEVIPLSTAAELNSLMFTYALTGHRSQGAEWRKVYIILHHVHAGFYSREWLYTAMTRAREECYILARPAALEKCVNRAIIKGRTLAEKAEYFKGKMEVAGGSLMNITGSVGGTEE